jgi:hypothetical protein
MKYLITLLLVLFFQNCFAVQTLDIAVEATSIKVEYIASSNRGIIYPHNCEQCDQDYYDFSQSPTIIKSGKKISFNSFMKDYWNAKFPTLLLDKKTKSVLKVVY